MKKLQKVKKLSLDRETLRQLESIYLSEAQGAATTTDNTCYRTSCGPVSCLC